jgi:hypothetical protein
MSPSSSAGRSSTRCPISRVRINVDLAVRDGLETLEHTTSPPGWAVSLTPDVASPVAQTVSKSTVARRGSGGRLGRSGADGVAFMACPDTLAAHHDHAGPPTWKSARQPRTGEVSPGGAPGGDSQDNAAAVRPTSTEAADLGRAVSRREDVLHRLSPRAAGWLSIPDSDHRREQLPRRPRAD